jgi:hypothetical protein
MDDLQRLVGSLAERALAGVGEAELAAYDSQRERERRLERLRDAGVLDVLPPAMVAALAHDRVSGTPALGYVRRWAAYQRTDGAKPVLALVGTMGLGKTVAGAWLLASEGGLYVEADELVRLHSAQWGPERKRYERLVRTGALVIDELHTEVDSRAAMRDVVNRRQGRRLTLVLGNLNRRDLEARLDPRTWDRMRACSVVIELHGESLRRGTL